MADTALNEDIEVFLTLIGSKGRFESLPSSLIIPKGETSVSFVLQTIDDLIYQSDEDFSLKISSPRAVLNFGSDTMVIHLKDNEVPNAEFSLASDYKDENAGTINVQVKLSSVSSSPVTLSWNISGTAAAGSGNDYLINTSSSLIIPAGQILGNISVTINDDLLNESSETLIFTLETPINAALGANTSHTLTITNNDLGDFSISGVTGAFDSTSDAFLIGGTAPKIEWNASADATSYEATIYASDGTTVICSTQNTSTLFYDFSSCALSLGATYKAKITAKSALLTKDALNNFYSFYVNRPPVANNDGPVRLMKNSSATTLQVITASDSGTRGTVGDSDPDAGDTFTITSITQGSMSGLVTNTSGTVTYTPTSNFTGVETFTYTLTDNHGESATGTVTVHVMDTYTWTGKVSSNWNVNGNWCGTISSNSCVGSTGYPNDTTTSSKVAIFDGTCLAVGHNCSANINTAVSAYGIKLSTGYTGTLTQLSGVGNTLSLGLTGFTQAGGTFVGANGAISTSGPTVISAGSITMPSTTFTTLSNWSITGSPTFNGNGGSVIFGNGSSTISHSIIPGSINYYNVSLSGYGSSYNLNSGTMNVYGAFTAYDGYGSNGFNSGTINSYGNITSAGVGLSGSALIVAAGNSSGQTISGAGGSFPSMRISAGVNPVTLSGSFKIIGNWDYISSGIFTSTGSTITFGNASATISHSITPGAVNYNNVSFSGWGSIYSLNAGSLNVYGTLTLHDSYGNAYINSGTIYAYGDVIASGGGIQHGSGVLVISGNSLGQTITGGNAYIPKCQINAGSNAVTLSGIIKIMSDWTYIGSGAFVATGSTIFFGNGSASVNHAFIPGPVTYENISTSGFGSTLNLSTSDLYMSGSLTMNDGYFNSGRFNMNGRAATIGSASLNSQTIVKTSGVLTIGGSVVGTGSLYGGNVNP